jgi:outer membrane protein assembly factor BamD
MGLTSEAQTAAAVLGHNYPDSQWYKDSYKLLQSGGLEPRENAGSWLARAGRKLLGASLGSGNSHLCSRSCRSAISF